MEKDSEESSDDVQGEDKPVVLWERCIQQSIFVDLSEDESLHLSDLENSLVLHMSQAESAASEASIHLSGSSELSALDDITSESSTVSSRSLNPAESKTKSSTKYVSAQRPNTVHNEPPVKQEIEDPGQNTSDEDQEDLPFDDDLRSSYFNHTASSLENSEEEHNVHECPDRPCLPELLQKDTNIKLNTSLEALVGVAPPCPSVPADVNHLLLRHFSQEEWLQSGRLIEAETLPEVSLLESVDDTGTAPSYSSRAIHSNKSGFPKESSITSCKNEILEVRAEGEMNEFTSTASDKRTSSLASPNESSKEISEDVAKQEKAERVPLVRTRSFTEIKYGQGQVHYPLPDFSKVASKLKIPKTQSGPVNPAPKTMHRAESSPGMLEVISRVLEDSVQPPEKPYVFRNSDHQQTPPALVHHLQVEYDKLLTKYAEAENLIDQMRLGNNLTSEEVLHSEHDGVQQVEVCEGSLLRHSDSHFSPSERVVENVTKTTQSTAMNKVTTASLNQHEESPSDGERMTAELRNIVTEFRQKVEDLKFIVNNMTVGTAEQQMMWRSMMEAQDQLERKYISKKEEHRALEMQNYMGLSRNTGTFDPNRFLEGDIFRIGMHLEDMKEVIDRNMYEHLSPPHASSTPTSMTVSLHTNHGPPAFDTPSPPSSLHEGSSAGFSSPSCKTDTQKEKTKEEEDSEVHDNSESSELIASEPLMQNVGRDICISRDLLGSLEGLQITEDEEGHKEERSSVLSDGRVHSDFFKILSETRSTSRQRKWTAESFLKSNNECDLGDCVSLAVEVSCSSQSPGDSNIHRNSDPPLSSSCASQRIVSPETDSGFGSSYLNQSANGTFQTNVFTGSEGLSASDSEGSCSHLDTAINSAHPSAQAQLCGAAAVELWVESTTKDPSVRLQETEQTLQHLVSEPVHSNTMDTAERHSPVKPCSCNSEAILALQSEVSRLKKNLEEGLVQLPHLTQRMNYLTSKYREEREERRSKTRKHQTPASSSLGKSFSRGVNNLTSSQLRMDDWISSDMDPSKSKGTNSSDGSYCEIMYDSSLERRKHEGNVHSAAESGEKLQEPAQSNRDIKSFHYKDRWPLLLTPSHQKPLLQVSYGSSSSLPASYKVREPQLQSFHRKRSTQSDSALLPNNVYFKRTPSPALLPPRSRRGKKDEDMNRTLDQAIEVARTLKMTTACMARRLSSDLAKAQLHRKLYSLQPLGGRKHQTF